MNGFWNLPGGRLALPQALYASYTTAYFGFMPKSFFSTDYFPLLPWLFLFWAKLLPPHSWAPNASRAHTGRSARRWAGWAVTRWCSICSISRSSWGC